MKEDAPFKTGCEEKTPPPLGEPSKRMHRPHGRNLKEAAKRMHHFFKMLRRFNRSVKKILARMHHAFEKSFKTICKRSLREYAPLLSETL